MKNSKNYQNINFLSEDQVLEKEDVLGVKTINLSICKNLGFDVPSFVAIEPEICQKMLHDLDLRKLVSMQIHEHLQSPMYAVRSSGLHEDRSNSSLAGQFKTICSVESSEIDSAIFQVLAHGNTFLNGSLDKFSLLIQKYIQPDISGVIFTRNPLGTPDMLIEYHSGAGEDLVSGKIRPDHFSFYWNQEIIKFPSELEGLRRFLDKIKSLEANFKWPQDIEWCIKNGSFFLLQSRPLTALDRKQYAQILFLDRVLPQKAFYFEKNGITEVAPRATPATMSIFKKIYSQDGPVSKVYKKYGIKFQQTDFLNIIGNELFVNKEFEVKSILPSYTYFRKKTNVPSLDIDSAILTTLKNGFFLSLSSLKISEKAIRRLGTQIANAIHAQSTSEQLDIALETFLTQYQIIFEINFLCELAVQNLKSGIKGSKTTVAACLQAPIDQFGFLNRADLQVNASNWIGNSLEISDEGKFIGASTQNVENEAFGRWWDALSQIKKEVFHKQISLAVDLNYLRELGRCLCISNLNHLRRLIFQFAKNEGFSNYRNIYFADLNELLENRISETTCIERHAAYQEFLDFNLPSRLSCVASVKSNEPIGVSPGLAEGKLIGPTDLVDGKLVGRNYILYTDVLSPDLAKYFDRICGIISREGGMLSHLSILARENRIPVVACYDLRFDQVKGFTASIDGSLGLVNLEGLLD